MSRNIVLYIDSMIMPDKNAAAQRASAICTSLNEIGKKTVIVGLNEEISSKKDIIETLSIFNSVDCYAVKYPKTVLEWINRMVTIKPFVSVMKYYKLQNIHAIIAMDYEVIALYRLKKYCGKYNIKLIADTVEWYEKSKSRFPIRIGKNIDTKVRMELLYPKLDYMICISKYLYNHYSKDVKNIVEIPGTIDPRNEKWKRVTPYRPNEIYKIGYAGHPGNQFEKERLDLLMEAICILNSKGIKCKLVMAGFDKAIFERQLKTMNKSGCYCECFEHHGILSHIDALNMIASCEFSAIIRENRQVTKAGFPTKLSESLGCGTPVITTDTSNISDYVKNGKNGFITETFELNSLVTTLEMAMTLSKDELLRMHIQTKIDNPLTYDRFNTVLKKLLA